MSRCPAAVISGCIFFHTQPADQAPWATRMVLPRGGEVAAPAPPDARLAPAAAAAPRNARRWISNPISPPLRTSLQKLMLTQPRWCEPASGGFGHQGDNMKTKGLAAVAAAVVSLFALGSAAGADSAGAGQG